MLSTLGILLSVMCLARPEMAPSPYWQQPNVFSSELPAHYTAPLSSPSSKMHYRVAASIGPTAVHHVLPQYASVDMDWWHDTSGSGGDWGNASVLYANFSSPRLQLLASALSPAFLRIGGSQDNIVKYQVGSMTRERCLEPSTFRGKPVTQCLTMARWAEILGFAAGAGLDVVFGTSSFFLDDPADTNLLDLLNYTKRTLNRSLYALELGEEMQPAACVTDPANCSLVRGYRALRRAVEGLWPRSGGSRSSTSSTTTTTTTSSAGGHATPLILGPCDGMVNEQPGDKFMNAFLKQVLQGEGLLDAVVMHSYNNDQKGGWKAPGLMDGGETQAQARTMLQFARQWPLPTTGAPAPLWCGECGPHNGGGIENVTDRVIASFWYLDALGSLARMGLVEHGRQALVGSHYGLLRDSDGSAASYMPRPDYWVLLAWKRLMGTAVLDLNITATACMS
eukprot:g1024.t1